MENESFGRLKQKALGYISDSSSRFFIFANEDYGLYLYMDNIRMAVVKSNCITEDIIFMAGRDVYADK